MSTTTAPAVVAAPAVLPTAGPRASAQVTATATATVRGDDGRYRVVTKPVVVPQGQVLPTNAAQLQSAAGLADDPAVAVGAAEKAALAAPVVWHDPADSAGRTVGVLGGAAAAVGAFCLWLVRRRRDDEQAPEQAVDVSPGPDAERP